jgi:hypothetical protein
MSKQALDAIWVDLDRNGQDMLLEFAYKLLNQPILKGGPYDGLRLDPMGQWNLWVNVKHRDGVVSRFQNTGEGCMPDVYPNRGDE